MRDCAKGKGQLVFWCLLIVRGEPGVSPELINMTTINYRQKALEQLDDYLAGKISRETIWQWAQEIMVSKEWDELPFDLQDAIHGIWLLHDKEGSWVPNVEELRKIRDGLAK